MEADDFLLSPSLKEALKRSYKASFMCCRIEKASLGNKAGLIGAATWAKRTTFASLIPVIKFFNWETGTEE